MKISQKDKSKAIKYISEIVVYCIIFWATHNSAELDLLILKNGKKLGFEFKYSDAPKLTPSMKISFDTLGLDELTVIYPGNRNYYLREDVKVVGLREY